MKHGKLRITSYRLSRQPRSSHAARALAVSLPATRNASHGGVIQTPRGAHNHPHVLRCTCQDHPRGGSTFVSQKSAWEQAKESLTIRRQNRTPSLKGSSPTLTGLLCFTEKMIGAKEFDPLSWGGGRWAEGNRLAFPKHRDRQTCVWQEPERRGCCGGSFLSHLPLILPGQ